MAALPKTDDTWREHYRTARDWALRHQQYMNCVVEPTGIGFNHRLRGPLGKRPSEKVMCFYYSKPKVTVGGKILIGFGRTYDDGEGKGQAFAVVSDCYSPNYSATDVRHINDGSIVALVPIDQFGLVDIPSQNEFAVREAMRKTEEAKQPVRVVKTDDIPCKASKIDCGDTEEKPPTQEDIVRAHQMLKSAADHENFKMQTAGYRFGPDVASWDKFYSNQVKVANEILARVPKSSPGPRVLEIEPKLHAAIIRNMLEPTAATTPMKVAAPPPKLTVDLGKVCVEKPVALRALLAKYGSIYGKPAYGARLLKTGLYDFYNRMTLYVHEKRDWQISFQWLAKSLDCICPIYHSVLSIERKSNTIELHDVPDYLKDKQQVVLKEIIETFKIEVVQVSHRRPRNYYDESIA